MYQDDHMLRINASSHAQSYYTTGDYYLGEKHELAGTWHGKGAARLGLSGEVTEQQWGALCKNTHPISGEKLTARTKKDRRQGYDFTWSVPKSISIAYAFTQDERILDAFRQSVTDTMEDIEREMKTRVRVKGADTDRTTGELTYGLFIHKVGRPEDGVPSPDLHAHGFCFNATYDRTEQKWKAGQFGDIKAQGAYFESLFRSRLADKLTALGLPVERTKHAFELEGFDRATVMKFSRRTQNIEAVAARLGITDPKLKAGLGAKTRKPKAKHLSLEELQSTWRSWLTPAESQTMLVTQHRLDHKQPARDYDLDEAGKAVQAALDHHFERASVVPERTVIATALKRSYGNATPEAVIDAFRRAELIRGERDGKQVVTTHDVLESERQLIDWARNGRGQCDPLAPSTYEITDTELSAGQRKAVEHILRSRDRLMMIKGAPGSGKTKSIRAAIAGIEAGGRKVVTVAPSAAAGRGTLRQEVSEHADTLSMLLTNPAMQERAKGGVLWVDESGMVGTRTMLKVFELANLLDTRIVLSGDPNQHGAILQGAVLHLLQTEAGVKSAELKTIMRQQGDYQRVVQAIVDEKFKDSLSMLQQLGWVHELPQAEERYRTLASDYVQAMKEHPSATLSVIAPTHREGKEVTRALRDRLREAGRIGKAERLVPMLRRVDLTESEKRDARNFQKGNVVVFTQNAPGYVKGSRVTVTDPDILPLEHADRFQLYRTESLPLAAGDTIRMTAGGSSNGFKFNNGGLYQVKSFDPKTGDIRLTNGRTIGANHGLIDHGYVSTSVAAQSRTVDRVFVAVGPASYPAASQNQWLVSVSRGQHRADLYCHSTEELIGAIGRKDDRLTATELTGGHPARVREQRHLAPEPELVTSRNRESERSR